MINWRLFIHKFYNNSKMLLSPSWGLWSACVFVFTKGQLFFVWVLVFSFLLIFRSIRIYHTRAKTEKQLYYHKDWEASIMFYYVFIQQNTVTFFSYSVRNYNAMTSEIRTKDNLWRKILEEILKGFFVTVEIYKRPGWKIFRNLINGECEIRMSWVENFLKKNTSC